VDCHETGVDNAVDEVGRGDTVEQSAANVAVGDSAEHPV
jgi:hypothetical protein